MKRILAVLFLLLGAVSLYAQEDAEDGYSIHVVQRGENLFRIALSYGLTTDELAGINGIVNPANIQVGQRLLVPESTAPVPAATPSIQSTEAMVSTGTPTPPLLDEYVLHTVQPGETLFRIATQYGSTVNEVSVANSILDPTRIFAGQQLIIPNVAPPDFLSDLPVPVSLLRVTPLVFAEGRTGKIQMQTDVPTTVSGTFLGEPLQVISEQDNTRHLMWVAIPVFTESGSYPLQLTLSPANGEVFSIDANIQVISGIYGSERINLIEGRDTLLNENVEDAEIQLLRNAASEFNPERYFDAPLGLPAAAGITSSFGTRRSYNGGAFDRYHSGTDFAGVPGTPIFAPAPGRVVLADELNVRGRATMIDHGWGIYTGYWHQTEIYVAPGDFVETGQVIGTIGSTGRVTGAHLHWELWVHGVPVDPMQWVKESFLWETYE